jgi:hypothetical protein
MKKLISFLIISLLPIIGCQPPHQKEIPQRVGHEMATYKCWTVNFTFLKWGEYDPEKRQVVVKMKVEPFINSGECWEQYQEWKVKFDACLEKWGDNFQGQKKTKQTIGTLILLVDEPHESDICHKDKWENHTPFKWFHIDNGTYKMKFTHDDLGEWDFGTIIKKYPKVVAE